MHNMNKGVRPRGTLFTENLTEQEESSFLKRCETFSYMHNDIILRANEVREGVYLVLSGMVEVYLPGDTDEVLEIIKEGELVGLSHLHQFLTAQMPTKLDSQIPTYPTPPSSQTDEATPLEVRAIDDVEALYIPFSVLKDRWEDHHVQSGMLKQVSARLHDVYQSIADQIKQRQSLGQPTPNTLSVQDIMTNTTDIIEADTTATIYAVAKKLSMSKATAALITENTKLKGIITQHDFVDRVIAQAKPTTDQVETIMTANPITIAPTAYFYEAITTMLLNGIKHLPVLDHNGKLKGIVTFADLLQHKQTTMLPNIEQLRIANIETLPDMKAALYATLRTMLQQQVPILHTLDSMNTLYDRLIHRCVELAIQDMSSPPPSRFCFYLMGSGARKEQFLLTDQDHFLVYEDDSDQAYFAQLAEEIVTNLESAGYQRCKGDMMASNPKWRGSLQQWESRIQEWMLHATNDRLLLAQNFFSYRFLYGEKSLHEIFKKTINNSLDRAKIFLYRLSQLERENPIPTLEQPIRSLFRLQRKALDLKKEILFPYHHSLQILALMHGITYGTPMEKIVQLHEKKILTTSFQKDLKASIATILDYYVKNRWSQHKAGENLTSQLSLASLTTREKEELMLSIRLIKELQSHMLSYY